MEKQLEQLTPLAQRAFAAALAQRMMPNFILFAELTEQSEAGHALQSALDTVWEKLLTPKAKINFEKQQLKLEELEPQPDDHDFFGVYPALDTYMAVLAVLAAMQDRDEQPALDVSRLSRGSVQFYLNIQAETTLDYSQLDQEPLWLEERDFQDQLLALLTDDPDEDSFRQARQLGRNDGISNLGIALEE
ncbi:YjaG family protein [Gallaecimonas pentaromativorans]|uniref:YjaG family protein n=1 Tax=Gallaecimonas pentaromativorans TaxID=584787 RepID=UPI003A91ACF7